MECPFRKKSLRPVVVAAVNSRREVMAVRNTQRNYGHDVGSTVRSGHLIPSPRIVPQLIDAQLKLTPPSVHFSLATSSTEMRPSLPKTVNQSSSTSFSTCFRESPTYRARSEAQRHSTGTGGVFYRKPCTAFWSREAWDFSSLNLELQTR